MSPTTHVLAVACVALIASGQVLFKCAANALKLSGTFLNGNVLAFTAVAIGIYAAATLLWIVLLQHAPLSRLYPYMALSFVLVAAASRLFFHEQIPAGQVAGLGLIVAGLLVVAAS